MEQILKNKVAVITGGSRGLGLAIAQTFARAGAKVVIASRSQRSVDSALQTLRSAGAQAEGLACDIADLAQVEALASHAVKTYGHIDIWVNNAGVSAPYGPTSQIPPRDFLSVIQTNITGTYHGSKVALRYFLPQKSGKLINILGRGDKGGVKYQNAYSASKIWVRNFTKTLAEECDKSGVDVIGFNPGLVLTEMLSQVQTVAGFENKVNPIRVVAALWGNPADVPAQKALWLASSATDGRNGLITTVLTPGFMLGRLFTAGLRMLFRAPVEMMDLNVSVVEPDKVIVPVLSEDVLASRIERE
jgi:glucose 1-dehydrogenase